MFNNAICGSFKTSRSNAACNLVLSSCWYMADGSVVDGITAVHSMLHSKNVTTVALNHSQIHSQDHRQIPITHLRIYQARGWLRGLLHWLRLTISLAITWILCDFDITLDTCDLKDWEKAGVEHMLSIAFAAVRIENNTDSFCTRVISWFYSKTKIVRNSMNGPRSDWVV